MCGSCANAPQHGSAPVHHLSLVQSGQGILVAAIATAGADLNVLRRNEEAADALKFRHFGPQPLDHLFNRFLANAPRALDLPASMPTLMTPRPIDEATLSTAGSAAINAAADC